MTSLFTKLLGGGLAKFGSDICKNDQIGIAGILIGLPSMFAGSSMVLSSIFSDEKQKNTEQENIETIKKKLSETESLLREMSKKSDDNLK